MHWSQALSRSHTQPILMPRTPPWKEKGRTEASDGAGWSRWGGAGGRDKWTGISRLLQGRAEVGERRGLCHGSLSEEAL